MSTIIITCECCTRFINDEMVWEQSDNEKNFYLYAVGRGFIPNKELLKQQCPYCIEELKMEGV